MNCRSAAWMALSLTTCVGCGSPHNETVPALRTSSASASSPQASATVPQSSAPAQPAANDGFRKDIFLAAYREAEKFDPSRPVKPEALSLEVRLLEPAVSSKRERDVLGLFKALLDAQELCVAVQVSSKRTRDLVSKWEEALAARDSLRGKIANHEAAWESLFCESMKDPSAIQRCTEWRDADARGYILVAATLANGTVVDVSGPFRKVNLKLDDGTYGRYAGRDESRLLSESLEATYRQTIGKMIHNNGTVD